MTTSALKIWDGTAGVHTLDIYNPNIDMSGATCNSACTANTGTTAIEVQGQKRATIYAPQLYGGISYSNANANDGITCTKVNACQVVGGVIGGFANGGMYVSGDLLTNNPKGYTVQVSGTLFEHNSSAIEAKFSLDDLVVTGAKFRYNHIAVGTYAAGTEPPARHITATGNSHKFTQYNDYQIASTTKGVVADNTMEDIGYDETGANPIASASFINDNGATGLTLSNNIMRMKDLSSVGTTITCILAQGVTYNSVLYTGGGLNGAGNTCDNANYGFYEGSGVASSTLIDEKFAIAANFATVTNAATVVDYYDANNLFTHTVGGVPQGFIGQIASQDLSAIGNLTNGSTSGQQVFPIAGARAGDTVLLTPITNGLNSNPGVRLTARSTNTGVQLYAFNGSGAAFNFAGETVRIEVKRGY